MTLKKKTRPSNKPVMYSTFQISFTIPNDYLVIFDTKKNADFVSTLDITDHFE